MQRLFLVLAILAPVCAVAAVVDSSSSGFTVKTTLTIQAPAADVYSRFIRNVGDWWSPDHTFSHDSHNVSIEEKPMGCFCEKLAAGGVRHMEVIYVERGRLIRMSGMLGPLQGLAASGVLTIELSPAGGGTKLEATYAVGGYLPKGMDSWAGTVDAVLAEQFGRLKNFVEHGTPESVKQ
jgi:uncharacterized protein YndB with AHSA1/START domain